MAFIVDIEKFVSRRVIAPTKVSQRAPPPFDHVIALTVRVKKTTPKGL
ncbi:hypothetical protein HCH_02070 [Hahella chejuensis KCTC 2396]|uniref:Uncharacterized protein n=1 Tax=Hahella chejuensis (strain KCTC 2396) TaxID=349521 RepID=Q2SKC3_HAHCH|nr:hypothetical protein HCH_02070 [Hahella chejuensis KCTC 2396]